MIRYTLVCAKDHQFEGWFRDSAAFEEQRAAGGLTCPVCGSAEVDRALMAPAVATRERAGAPVQMANAGPKRAELVEMLRRFKRHVVENSEYVGDRFPEEARKIHYREVDPRAIYGEASLDEARSLIEEGVEVHPLPVLPEERN